VQPALRRHQSGQGGSGVRRVHHAGYPLAGLRLGGPTLLRLGLLRTTVPVRCALVQKGKAYVCDLSARRGPRIPRNADRTGQGEPVPQPDRRREPGSLRAHAGREFPDGSRTLRAKIDMTSPNIICATRSCTASCTPRITARVTRGASIRCTTLLTVNRTPSRASPIRSARWSMRFTGRCTIGSWTNWRSTIPPDRVARLNVSYTVLSKRKPPQLVQDGHVRGWDDPACPRSPGCRRRGYTPEAIRDFCERIGVAKKDSIVDLALLSIACADLNKRAPRAMGVLRPLRVVIENYPEGQSRSSTRSRTRKIRPPGMRRVPFSACCTSSRTTSARRPRPSITGLPRGAKSGCARRIS